MTTVRAPQPVPQPSDIAGWDDLCLLDQSHRTPEYAPELPDGWHGRWALDVTTAGDVDRVPVHRVRAAMFDDAQPCRRFSWRTSQRHRPGLMYMQSLRRHVGFESLQEQRFLLALDFDGGAHDVLGQPFALRYVDRRRWRLHVPDYLLRTDRGVVLVNVRPEGLVEDDDRRNFAALDAVAAHHSWRHEVVTGWRQPAMSTVDTLSAHRRPMKDPLGVRAQVLDALDRHGPQPFAALAETTGCEAVARAFICALLWHRDATIDLGRPLGDQTVVLPALHRAAAR